MPRLQDLPRAAFFPPDEALALFERGDRSVFVLSYGWNRCAPPSDPSGVTLEAVRRYLKSEGAKNGDLIMVGNVDFTYFEESPMAARARLAGYVDKDDEEKN